MNYTCRICHANTTFCGICPKCGFDCSIDWITSPILFDLDGDLQLLPYQEKLCAANGQKLCCSNCGGNTFCFLLSKNAISCASCGHSLSSDELPPFVHVDASCEIDAKLEAITQRLKRFSEKRGSDFTLSFEGDNEYPNKLKNAQRSYFAYNLDANEKAVLLCDKSTNGRRGFVLTNKRLFEGSIISQFCVSLSEIRKFEDKSNSVVLLFIKEGAVGEKALCTTGSSEDAINMCSALNEMVSYYRRDHQNQETKQ